MDKINQIGLELDDYSISNAISCDVNTATSLITSSNNLNVICQNIRSIGCNMPQFQVLLAQFKVEFDILILTECWLNKTNNPPSLDDYTYFQTNEHKSQNEGVVIYIKNHLESTIYEPSYSDSNCLVVKLGRETAIIAVYRPPSLNIDNFIETTDAVLLSLASYKNIILMGDINISIKEYNNDSRSHEYLNLMASHGLLPAHLLPTREQNCLDHVMIKSGLKSSTYVVTTTITDHFTICLSTALKLQKHHHNITKQITNYAAVLKDLENTNFNDIYNCTNVDNALNILIKILQHSIKINSNLRTVSHRKVILKPWITPGLLRCIRHRDRLHMSVRKSPKDDKLKLIYSRYRNFCNMILHKVKNSYDKSELQKVSKDPKKTWKIIKKLTCINKQRETNEPLLKQCETPQLSVEYTNSFFATVGQKLADQCPEVVNQVTYLQESTLNSFVLLETDNAEVFSVITNLKDDCAIGFDGISPKLLKICRYVLTPVITYICNLSFKTGTFPRHFKTALIHPIFKSGDRDSVNNYRPISVLPAMSKILEKLINNRLIAYLDKNKLISSNQFGFTRGKCTEDALRTFTEYVVTALDSNFKCIGVFLDLAKAFDTVSIPILLDKIELMGIRGNSLELFRSYLKNRSQRVKIGSHVSADSPIAFGVPQGSIVGPTLFLMYINQLCNLKLKNAHIVTFADDTAIIFHEQNWIDTIKTTESGLTNVINWLNTNKLTINISKTKYLTFSINQLGQPTYNETSVRVHTCSLTKTTHCQCPNLEKVDCIKYLGVWVDQNLNWHKHVDLLTNRVRKLMPVFKKLRHIEDMALIKMVYYSLCQSIVDYCIAVWGGTHKNNIIKLERAQRAVLKVATSKPRLHPTTLLYKECGVLTVRQLFVLKSVLHAHQSCRQLPLLNQRRKDNVFRIKHHRTVFSSRHPLYIAPHLYNTLSKTIPLRNLTFSKCKHVVKNFLLSINYNETELLFFKPQ